MNCKVKFAADDVPSASSELHPHGTTPWTNEDASFCNAEHQTEHALHLLVAASTGSGLQTRLRHAGLSHLPVGKSARSQFLGIC